MNLPNKVVDRIFENHKHDGASCIKDELDKANEVISSIYKQRQILNKAKEEFDKQSKFYLDELKSARDLCNHLWESHRSSIDSADDFDECIICGKQR